MHDEIDSLRPVARSFLVQPTPLACGLYAIDKRLWINHSLSSRVRFSDLNHPTGQSFA